MGSQNLELRNSIRNIEFQGPQVLVSFLDHNPKFVYATSFVQLSLNFFEICSCVLLDEKNIKRAKSKKSLDKKRKEKNSKRKEKIRKKEHIRNTSIALLFVVFFFTLSIFPLLPFVLVSLPCLSQLVLGTRIGQQLG
jgi:Na+/H+ antiporter NhaD/arsenite permease-like protein